MKFSEQSDEPMPCVDCGHEVGLHCYCPGKCRQCGMPWLLGLAGCCLKCSGTGVRS